MELEHLIRITTTVFIVVIVMHLFSLRNKKGGSLVKRTLTTLMIASVAAISAGGASFFGQYMRNEFGKESSIDAAMREFSEMKLIGAILRTESGAHGRLQEALSHADEDGDFSRVRALIIEMRAEYLAPSVYSANDELIFEAWDRKIDFLLYHRYTSTHICSEFFMEGLNDLSILDQNGQELFRDLMEILEEIYINGRGLPPKDRELDDQDFDDLNEIIEFSEEDWLLLTSPDTSDDLRCDTGLRFLEAVRTKLHPDSQPLVMRFVLAN